MFEDIVRIRGTRMTSLGSISNQENHIQDIISNYSANQQNALNLKAKKNSLTEKIETVVHILQKRYRNTQVLISSFMNKFVTLAEVKNDCRAMNKAFTLALCELSL